jgi:hypothetical protein
LGQKQTFRATGKYVRFAAISRNFSLHSTFIEEDPDKLVLVFVILALSRGMPEVRLTFALAMMLGVAFTLCLVALFTIFERDRLVLFLNAHGAKIELSARYLEGMAGG